MYYGQNNTRKVHILFKYNSLKKNYLFKLNVKFRIQIDIFLM